MRVVVAANVLVSAVISSAGPPRAVLTAWTRERFELVASPRFWRSSARSWRARAPSLGSDQATTAYLAGLGQDALLIGDPPPMPGLTADLLELTEPEPPVLTPRAFRALLQDGA